MTTRKYLGHGLYSISDAARVISVPPNRLRHWVQGYYYESAEARKRQVSVVPRFYGDDEPLAFVELIELLFVSEFQRIGLSMQYIRKAAARARQEFNTPYPFAVKRFATDGREIFTTVAIQEQPRTATYEIVHGQGVFNSIVRRYFKYHLDIEREFANRYWPLGRRQRVVLDASRAFGAPIDEPTGVPTEALVAALEAGDSEEDVAAWFEVPIQAIRTSLKYERRPVAA